MRIVPTLQLVPSMIAAQDVLSMDNRFILRKGTTLTDSLITKLDLYGVLSVAVQKESVLRPQDWQDPEQSFVDRVKNSPEFKGFHNDYVVEVDTFKGKLNTVITKNAPLDVQSMIDDALKLIKEHRGRIGIFDMLHNMREFDDSTYSHCMNVGLICYIFAGWMKMDKAEAELATACGLLHDIGKLLVSKEIIQKPGKLTRDEFEEMKKHPSTGYKLLKEQSISEAICNAALMHHERCDGTGYPFGLAEPKIDKYAKMVAIADVYDAMTSSRVYHGPMCPFHVIEIFEDEGFQKYDVNFILTFLENIVNTYITNPCRLNDGREAKIIFVNKHKLSRPTVKCGDEYINLSETPDLFIECLL